MCSINVCGLKSKMKYNVLESYLNSFQFICLTETKCKSVEEIEIFGYTPFVMSKMCTKHMYGGIHGICILVEDSIATHCTIITDFVSESILWLYVDKNVLGYDFILGAVYLPHEASVHYHDYVFEYLCNDLITIGATYNVPVILLGDFNARTGITNDFEHDLNKLDFLMDNDQCVEYFEIIT